jgi:uncharacterized protein
MTPLDITKDNTPIQKDAKPEKADCGCGGKGKGQCGSDKTAPKESGSCTMPASCITIVAATLIGLGFALAGYFIGDSVADVITSQRVIDARGFSERDVKADLAIWTIGYVATGDDMTLVQEKVENDSEKIRAFLKQNGLMDAEIIEQPTSMTDLLSRDYRPEGVTKGRYIVNATIRVRSEKVDLVASLSGMKIGALIKAGVTLREGQPPVYLFTKLKNIKPEMVAEATEDAKRAAQQFAKDSDAHLGGMKSAAQGVFQILPRDQAMGINEDNEISKTVRVVTTAQYFLVD